tara:strand:+ start:10038 stop:10751 length:714 start_codon:yes stop_codon:yes gene_type:complete
VQNDLVSVIIPSYNRFKYLSNAIESVLSQTYQKIEIIVVNDGSTEEEYYKNNFIDKVTFINLEINQTKLNGFGPGSIRNFGCQVAKGKYLAFLDDDDIWLPKKIELQLNHMHNLQCKMSSTDGFFGMGVYEKNKKYEIYNKEKFIKTLRKKYKKTSYLKGGIFPEIWDLEFLKIHNCMITSSIVVEKELFDLVGGFRGIPGPEDYDCWLGLLHHTSSAYVDAPLFYYDGNHGKGKNY